MSWAARRRFFILLIIGAVVASFALVVFFAAVYQAPSCGDRIQNQGEDGVDCGGPCSYLCTELQLPPTVLYSKPLQNVSSRTDVVAAIENKNATVAARNVPYTVTLYGENQILIQQSSGTVDLPPSTIVPVYLPGIASGKQKVTRAFLEIDSDAPRWFTMTTDPRVLPTVSNIKLGGTLQMPRIEATLSNPTIPGLQNVRVVVTVDGLDGNVIAASQTIIPEVPAQGQAVATFTWNTPFTGAPAAIHVEPIIPLP
jgi:hypothetical protein